MKSFGLFLYALTWLGCLRLLQAYKPVLSSSLWIPTHAGSDDRLHAYSNVTNGVMNGLRGAALPWFRPLSST